MAEVKYTKTIVLETSDGQVTLTGGQARAMQRKLEDASRYFHLVTDADKGEVTYYNVDSASCGFCKVATVTPGTEDAEGVECEDALPNCDESNS